MCVHAITGGSVLLESRPNDVAIDMNQLSQQRQAQQQILDEQVGSTFCGVHTEPMTHPTGPLHTRESRDNGKHRIHHSGIRCNIQAAS